MKTKAEKAAYMRIWRSNNPALAQAAVRRSLQKARFGGNREAAIRRDGEKCVECGISREQHRKTFLRDITVDHKDGRGRNAKEKNHDISNLITLCLPCHGRKDVLQLRWRK